MGVKIAEAYVELRTKGDKGRAEARQQATTMAKEATKAFAQFFSAAIFVDQIGKAVSAASELEQAIGGTRATFKQAAPIIDTFARGAAEGFGISERAARTLTSQIGGLLKGFGFTTDEAAKTSVQLAQLGADLAATFGGKPEDAVLALGAALRGEFDPLERFGVSLSVAQINLKAVELGLGDAAKAGDPLARAQAALALIMERSADAQGQFGREAETAAGQTAILSAKFEDARAKLGAQLLPVFSRAVDLLTGLVDGFSALPGPVQTAVVALAGIAIIAGPVKRVAEAFGGLTTIIKKLGPASIATAGVIGAAALIYIAYSRRKEGARIATEEFTTALKAEAQGQRDAVAAAIAGRISTEGFVKAQQAAKVSTEDVARFIRGEAVPAIEELIEASQPRQGLLFDESSEGALADFADQLGITADEAREFLATLDDSRTGYAAAAEAIKRLSIVQGDLGVSTDETGAALGELDAETAAAATGVGVLSDAVSATQSPLEAFVTGTDLAALAASDAATETERMATETAKATEAALAAAEALLEQADAMRGSVDAGFALRDAQRQAADAAIAVDEVIANQESTMQDLAEALDRAAEAAIGVADAEVRQATETAKAKGETITAWQQTDIFNRSLLNQVSTLTGPTRDSLVKHIAQLNGIPEEEATAILALINEGHIAEAERRLQDTSRTREAQMDAQANTAQAERDLNQVARDRNANIYAKLRASQNLTGLNVGEFGLSEGGYVGGPAFAALGEGGRPEVVLPLTKPNRIRELLADARVAGPLAAAVGGAATGGVFGDARGVMPVASGGIVINGGVTVAQPVEFRRELELFMWEQSVRRGNSGGGGALA